MRGWGNFDVKLRVSKVVINRYYDPTTDQFLSIDPDVTTTYQPYVFTNDDPLNAEDPLGQSWWSIIKTVAAVATSGVVDAVTAIIPGADESGFGEEADAWADGEIFDALDGASGSEDDIPGLSSDYKDTTIGKSIRNVETNVTPKEFGENLKDAGWKETTVDDGRVTNYTKDGAKYSVYSEAKSTGGPTASFFPEEGAKATLKIRLGT